MKSKGSYNAYEIDMDYRHEQYMKRKIELKKFKNNKTGIIKEEKKDESKSNSRIQKQKGN